jgi:hypothetical protein
MDEQFCWFVVPEIILGVPKYDQASCIAYLLDKLKSNGFNVKYIHPNTLFISWMHWVPSYVRTELKKKTGIEINEYGLKVENDSNNNNNNNNDQPFKLKYDPDDFILNMKEPPSSLQENSKTPKKNYTPIKSYKPSGNLIYDEDLLSKMEDKFNS